MPRAVLGKDAVKKPAKYTAVQRVAEIMLTPSLLTVEQNGEGQTRRTRQVRKKDGKPEVIPFYHSPAHPFALALDVMLFVFGFFLSRDPNTARQQLQRLETAWAALKLRIEEDADGRTVLVADPPEVPGS